MKFKFFSFEEKLNFQKILLIFGLIFTFLSIGFNPQKLLIFIQPNLEFNFYYNYSQFGIKYLLDILRGVTTLIYFPILLYFFLRFIFTNKIIFKSNIFFFLFFAYLAIQCVGFFTAETLYEKHSSLSQKQELTNLYYLFNSLVVLIIFYLSLRIFSKNDYKVFLFVIVFFFVLMFLFYTFKYLNYFLKTPDILLYHIWGDIEKTDMSAPRPTGLSRTALLLLISLHLYTFLKNDNKKLNHFFLIILAGIIYMLAARSSMLLLAIYIFAHFFFNRKKVSFFYYLKIFIIFPLIFYYTFNYSKFYISKRIIINQQIDCKIFPNKDHKTECLELLKDAKKLNISSRNIINNYKKLISKKTKKCSYVPSPDSSCLTESEKNFLYLEKNRFKKTFAFKATLRNHRQGKYGSGRIGDWKGIIFENQKKFFGNGVQGDRLLINQSASNGLMYAYASGGIFGLLIMILFSLLVFYYSITLFIKSSNKKMSLLTEITKYTIIILLIRSVFETGYGVFGIDLIIFVLCGLTLEYKFRKE